MEDFVQITLDAFARIQARADKGVALGELLTHEGLSGEVWVAAKKGWLSLIGADTQRGDFRLSQRYQSAYLAERPELLAAAEPAQPEGSDALSLAGASAPAMKAPVSVSLTGETMTLKGDLRVDLKQHLPFKGQAEAPESAADQLEPVADHEVGQTVMGEVNVADLGLPFGPKPAPAPSPPPDSPQQEPPPQPPEQREAPDFGNMTLKGGEAPINIRDLLPFKGKASAPKSALGDLEPVSERDMGHTLTGTPGAADVTPVFARRPTPAESPPRKDGTPAAPDAPAELTVSQYAAYCAERRLWPNASAARDRRYGLSGQPATQQLDSWWRARCKKDPALGSELDALIARWEAWHRQNA